MKLKSLLLSLLLIMVSSVAIAQVEDGKAYRIVNGKYGTVISASPITHQLSCVEKGAATDYQQMWLFEKQGDGRFLIKNIFTRRYVQNESGTNVAFKTGTEKVAFDIKANSVKGYYNIDASSKSGGWGLHCASGATVVPWSYGPVDGEVSGSEWQFEAVSIDQAAIDQAYEEYGSYLATVDKIGEIEAEAVKFFKDNACTELKDEYAKMSDADLTKALSNFPADLQAAIIKIKNNAWNATVREKDFRVYDYKPYSNPETWANRLNLRPFNRINNPTGICTESDREFVYVFVDNIPAGTTVSLSQMQSTKYFGVDNDLHVGLNVIPSAYKNGTLFIRYVCETAVGGKKLADYPTVKVHIENGYVNGFWSKERGHTNADWKYMQENMFKNPESVIAVGDLTMLNFRKAEFLRADGCPAKITELMGLWDFWNTSQQKNMALDKYWDYFNNKQLAMSDDGGFMDAGNYRTHYNNNTLSTITNYDLLVRDAGSAWGPNHEIGHTNQYAFQIVGTSEVSNNALSNFAIFEVGTHTSRGNNLENQILDFENNVPYVVRGEKKFGSKLFSMTRMYFQLYLYFHAAGKDKTFYPRLFEALREDPIVKHGSGGACGGDCQDGEGSPLTNSGGYILGSMNAKYDQLKFVEKCCEIAQMDLTEFFESWGFFIPMKNMYVSDYSHYHVYLTQSAIDSCKAAIKEKNYPKKGGHLMFLEDRIRPSKKMKSAVNNDASGYRADYSNEVPVGASTGLYGQWEDYIDESVKAEGYFYAISGGKVEIMEAAGAKGALGFKLYNADNGKLLTFTNKRSMTIPMSSRNANLKIVAAQADGTDYVVPHASKGPESMQLTALEKSLEAAKKAVGRKAKDGNEIGYFHADSIAKLESIYNEAAAAKKNNDTKKYSYAEWSVMLDSELARLNADPANRIELEENMSAYFVQTGSYRGQALAYDSESLKARTGNYTTAPEMSWTIEYAGKYGEYYLKNATGYYIKDFGMGNTVYADVKSSVAAAKFNIGYTDAGKIFFTLVGNPSLAFGLANAKDGNNYIAGMSADEAEAQWRGYVIEDNSAAFYKQELADALQKANFMITEIINLNNLNTMNIFNDGIMVIDRNLETYAVALLDAYNKIAKDKENAVMHKSYLTELRNLFNTIEGTYVVTTPIATKGNKVVWYRIVSAETGKYLSVKDGSSERNKNRLAVVNAKDVNDDCLWSFASAGMGQFRLYNAGRESFMYHNPAQARYMYVSAEDVTPISVEFNNEAEALAIIVKDKALDEGSSNVDLTDPVAPSYWELELVSIESNKSMADIITTIEKVLPAVDVNSEVYDLNGRKVVNPTNGIYIQNGKKVLVK